MKKSSHRNKPNILFITSDQQRGDCLGCMGHPCVRTPHLDMLAKEGVLFTQAHSDCPVCIPARTTMITGVQSSIYGMPSYAEKHRIVRDRRDFLGSIMTSAGYQTCLVGKSHWHTEPDFAGGFETWISFSQMDREIRRHAGIFAEHGIGANEFSPALSSLNPAFHSTNWVMGKGMDFLEDREKARPFFLWLSMIDPHPAAAIHEPYYSMYDGEDIPAPRIPEWSTATDCPYAIRKLQAGNSHDHMTRKAVEKAHGVYYGKITNIDHQLGRIFGWLKSHGLWDSTLILYTSDHGELLGDCGTYFKANFIEGAAHIPMLAKFPAGVGARKNSKTGAVVGPDDLLPTFCEIAGAPAPRDASGKSLLPLARGEASRLREYYHGQIDNQHMILDENYKYLYFADDGREMLFDRSGDPYDMHDLSSEKASICRGCRAKLEKTLKDKGSPHIRNGKLVNLKTKPLPGEFDYGLAWMGLH